MGRKTVRNKITTEKLLEEINLKNKALAEKFLKYKAIKVSPNTITVYSSNLDIFFCWNVLHNNNKLFVDIKKIEFSEFFSFCSEELELGSSRLNNLRSTLSSFSDFIETFYDEEYPDFRNVILKVVESAPKETRREKTILTDEQVEGLLEHLYKKDKQRACWVALAICSGARFSELLFFETNLIDENRTAFGDIFLETTREIKTKGRGKSGKMLYKYILRDKFLPYYNAWLKEREQILKENKQEHDFLFIKQNGEPATEATIRGWLKYFGKYTGVPIYAHAFRHYLTTMLSKKNIPHVFIKEIFGWESLEMVQIYDDSTLKDREFKELDNLKL